LSCRQDLTAQSKPYSFHPPFASFLRRSQPLQKTVVVAAALPKPMTGTIVRNCRYYQQVYLCFKGADYSRGVVNIAPTLRSQSFCRMLGNSPLVLRQAFQLLH
jgi:hypothetical protein